MYRERVIFGLVNRPEKSTDVRNACFDVVFDSYYLRIISEEPTNTSLFKDDLVNVWFSDLLVLMIPLYQQPFDRVVSRLTRNDVQQDTTELGQHERQTQARDGQISISHRTSETYQPRKIRRKFLDSS